MADPARLRVFRDGKDIVVRVFVPEDADVWPELGAFGKGLGSAWMAWEPLPAVRMPSVVIRCPKGDLMPLRAALDYLSDRGIETELEPFLARRLAAV